MPGEFIIEISGKERERGGFEKLVNMLKPRLETFAPGYVIDIYNFARINFRIVIIGKPTRFDYVDNFQKSMKINLFKYLRYWEYNISVKFEESG